MAKESEKHNTIVIKLGTSSLCDEKTREHKIASMSLIVELAVKLRRDGHRVVIVSSGGIAVGLKRMKKSHRPKHLPAVQAVASIGQARLIGLWDSLFRQLDQPVGQILLTRNDISDRSQYLNAANTMHELLDMGVIPIVNENDTLSMHEIQFGDNDTLSAITASMVNADYLFLMTDVDCLYTANPRTCPDAKPILVVDNVAHLRVDVSSPGSMVGTGGMTTKLIAAELATSTGVTTIICRSEIPGNVKAIVDYIRHREDIKAGDIDEQFQQLELKSLEEQHVPLHTRFLPRKSPIRDRQFWLLHGLTAHGNIYVDQGASSAITRTNRAGLLPVGIIKAEGVFHTMECVSVYTAFRDEKDPTAIATDKPTVLIGRALVNYSSAEIERIKGLRSDLIEKELGYVDSEYIAYRDNMAFYVKESVITQKSLVDLE